MPRLRILDTDILDSPRPVLVLPYDGMNRRFEGGVISAFRDRWPEPAAAFAAQLAQQPPLPFGSIRPFDGHGTSFEWVVLASTHPHVPSDTSTAGVRAIVAYATLQCLAWAERRTVAIAIPLLGGGWRLSPIDAAYAMMDKLDGAPAGVELDIHTRQDSEAVRQAFEAQGWL